MVILNYIESQKKFSDCINPDTGHQLRFDFYLPEENILIEYDGKQHFCFVPEWTKDKQNFIKRKKIDKVKNKYSEIQKIKLIRIKYTIKAVHKILKKEILGVS